jgi:hypothetical protein
MAYPQNPVIFLLFWNLLDELPEEESDLFEGGPGGRQEDEENYNPEEIFFKKTDQRKDQKN